MKALTGCRLDDICNLRSEQLTEGRLVFTADNTKNRSERYAILPPELYAELDAYKGEEYLWERYPAELIEANRKNGFPVHRQKFDFAPRRLYLWVVQLTQYYQKATGRDLSSHDFRRAAFTRAAEADIHPKRAAVAFDVTAETILRYYTATKKKRTADEVLSKLQGQLMPKSLPMARPVDTMPVGQSWATLGRRMATIRAISEMKNAAEMTLFSENHPELTHLAEMAQNRGSGVDINPYC